MPEEAATTAAVPSRRRGAGHAGRILTAGYALGVAGFVFFAAWSGFQTRYRLPWADDWRILDDLFSGSLVPWVLTDQVGHRMPVTLMLIYLDYGWFAGTMGLVVGASLACVGGAAAACYAAWRTVPGSRPLAHPGFLFSVFALTWAASIFDLPWGTNQGTLMAGMWLCTALALAARYQRSRLEGTPRPRLLGAALLCAVGATFSQGIGVATFVGLFVAAVVACFGWRALAAIVATAGATVAVYTIGLTHQAADPDLYARALSRLLARLATMTLAFVGNPVAMAVDALLPLEVDQHLLLAAIVGGVAVPYVAVVAARRRASGPVSPLAVFGAGLAAFGVAGGALVALNRVAFPESAISTRFATGSTMFWIGLIALAASRDTGRARPRRAGAAALAWLVSLAMVPAFDGARVGHQGVVGVQRLQWAMHRLGIQAPSHARGTFMGNDVEQVFRVAARVVREGRGPLAGVSRPAKGSQVTERFASAAPGRCRGAVGRFEVLEARGGPAAWLRGRVYDLHDDAPPVFVVGLDSQGRVQALGEIAGSGQDPGTQASQGVDAARATPLRRWWTWAGYLADYRPGERYAFHAVLDDGRTLCLFDQTEGTARVGRQAPGRAKGDGGLTTRSGGVVPGLLQPVAPR